MYFWVRLPSQQQIPERALTRRCGPLGTRPLLNTGFLTISSISTEKYFTVPLVGFEHGTPLTDEAVGSGGTSRSTSADPVCHFYPATPWFSGQPRLSKKCVELHAPRMYVRVCKSNSPQGGVRSKQMALYLVWYWPTNR